MSVHKEIEAIKIMQDQIDTFDSFSNLRLNYIFKY
jgi:hypothetical protein